MAGGFLDTYGSQAKAIGAIIALVVAVGSAGKWVYDRFESLEDDHREVEQLNERLKALQDRVSALEQKLPANQHEQERALRVVLDATRERFLEDERAAAELRGTVVALITEVRVRHGQPGYVTPRSMRPPAYGTYGGGDGGSRDRVRAQVKQNKAAAEALDLMLGRTIDAIPQKEPLSGVDL